MCIGNAYKLWCLETNTKRGLLHFREQLLEQIAAAYPSQRTHVQPGVPAPPHRATVGHYPKHSHKTRKCVHCTKGMAGGARSEIMCDVCEVHLCIDPCFRLYHEGQQQGS